MKENNVGTSFGADSNNNEEKAGGVDQGTSTTPLSQEVRKQSTNEDASRAVTAVSGLALRGHTIVRKKEGCNIS